MKIHVQKVLAIAMFALACLAFALSLCDFASYAKLSDMLFRTLLIVYLLLYMKD